MIRIPQKTLAILLLLNATRIKKIVISPVVLPLCRIWALWRERACTRPEQSSCRQARPLAKARLSHLLDCPVKPLGLPRTREKWWRRHNLCPPWKSDSRGFYEVAYGCVLFNKLKSLLRLWASWKPTFSLRSFCELPGFVIDEFC